MKNPKIQEINSFREAEMNLILILIVIRIFILMNFCWKEILTVLFVASFIDDALKFLLIKTGVSVCVDFIYNGQILIAFKFMCIQFPYHHLKKIKHCNNVFLNLEFLLNKHKYF